MPDLSLRLLAPDIVAGVLAALVAFSGGCLWRWLALRHGWVDWPDARRLHTAPTPRGGGIGILIALLGGLLLGFGLDRPYWVVAGLLLTAGGGLLDDLRPLSAVPKLLLQAAGTLPLALAWPLPAEAFGPVAGVLLAWLLAVALVNAWNFMDGSNGMVATQGAIVGAAAFVLPIVALQVPRFFPVEAIIADADFGQKTQLIGGLLAAACLGFLPLNVARARVFLGDVGSYAIGYAVAALALLAVHGPRMPGVLIWLPLSAVVIDTGLTLLGRLARRERFWLGHRQHLYQRAIAAGCSHGAVCVAYALWTAGACAAAGWVLASGSERPAAVVLAVHAVGILLYFAAGLRWRRPAPAEEGGR